MRERERKDNWSHGFVVEQDGKRERERQIDRQGDRLELAVCEEERERER